MKLFTFVFFLVLSTETSLVLFLHLLPRLGGFGKNILAKLSQAPGLDAIVSLLLWIPWLIGALIAGWSGIVAAIVAQFLVMQLWVFVHEFVHRQTLKEGSKIHSFMNQKFGCRP